MKPCPVLMLVFLNVGCTQPVPPPVLVPQHPAPPVSESRLHAFLEHASDSEIRARAIAMAREDIRDGTPHVAWAGSIGLYRPNIPPDKEHLVAKLPPLNGLPGGCTNPLVRQGMTFATAYNGELVKHLPLQGQR